ncbi:vesicle-associated protein 1-2-like [Salvia splendens]|uniref:vesicle-associated protein 1-2-like n=1 Tax=Salvia splendens TaxID=180675 RepID=UPI001C26D845|nr:vesicle-associated protein 1-2-like [Salvia splendens]
MKFNHYLSLISLLNLTLSELRITSKFFVILYVYVFSNSFSSQFVFVASLFETHKMSTGEFLNVDPVEMKFPFELKKQISCSLQVSNKTESHVAFKIKTTNPKKYCVRPNTGIVLPRSTCDIVVTMQAQKELPTEMQCKDKFLLQSVIAPAGTSPKDITAEMFNKDEGKVEECKLKVVYISPHQPPSPVAEEADEGGFSPCTNTMDNSGSEANSLTSKLTEEKAAAVQQGNKIRQELDVLKRDGKKRSGVSIALVIIIGVVGLVMGYLFKST